MLAEHATRASTVNDVATSSNYLDIHMKNYDFDMVVDFCEKTIKSTLVLDCHILKQCDKVVLDIHDTLQVHDASIQPQQRLKFMVQPFTAYGCSLVVSLPRPFSPGEMLKLSLDYTATGGPGVVWLDPIQTAGKKLPFLYTQGQAVMNRSFFPCQDTPALKSTFSASIQVTSEFSVLMSANQNNFAEIQKIPLKDKSEKKEYRFTQTTPIPVYLVAMAVGDIGGETIGPRSMVYAEPCLLEKAKYEFGGVVEEFLSTGEKLYGPYVWGRYDILIMPPSFPFGGMENPCLTFVTPCLLAGDKSLTDVIIHEISHSWFGNLVTNANWGEFWLNEGFTMFAQRRIMEELYGEEYMCLEASVGQELLDQTIAELGQDHPLTCLRVIISPGVDPDDTYNETPYEKGFCFVSYLQHLAGGKKQFTEFLKHYVDTFKYKCVLAEDMFELYLNFFPHVKERKLHEKPANEFTTWLTKGGSPLYRPDLSAKSILTNPVNDLADLFTSNHNVTQVPKEVKSWKTYQVVYLLDRLLEKSPLPSGNLEKFISLLPHIVNSENAELKLRWSRIIIRNNHESCFKVVEEFLHNQGKIKYTVPIYKELLNGSATSRDFAKTVYKVTRPQLHEEVRKRVDKLFAENGL